jgi:LmbE family N-acetylglucosaminyl deacetylase
MRIASAEVWPKAILKIFTVTLILLSASLAQAPAGSAVKSTSTPGFYDPLPQDTGEAGLKLELRKLQTTGRLMMVVAHPDDEDGGLLTREARGKGIQTLLMTLTRGEGGQNETGSTFSDQLGILRTLELLAADRYYGVEQRFSRVADFGYSKTADETFQKWGGHDVPLADIVRVIREFRPDVLIARFSGTERDGHGHHQASSMLTQEAFRAAADPNRFPEQIKEGLQAWQPKKLYIGNVCGFGATTCADANYTVQLTTSEVDPVLGMSYVQFAIEGLKHQTSQGLGDISIPSGPRYAFYKLVDSVVPNTKDEKGHEKDLFDGIDTGLSGLGGGNPHWLTTELQKISDDIAEAKTREPLAAVEPLLDSFSRLNSSVAKITNSGLKGREKALIDLLNVKQSEANHALDLALGISAEAVTTTSGTVSPREEVKFNLRFRNGSPHDLRISHGGPLPALDLGVDSPHIPIRSGADYSTKTSFVVPDLRRMYTRPYWHRNDPGKDSINSIDDPYFATLPFPQYQLRETVGYSLVHHAMPQMPSSWREPWPEILLPLFAEVPLENGMKRKQQVAIVPPFSIAVEPGEQVTPVADRKGTTVKVGVTANIAGAPNSMLRLDLPSTWHSEPSKLEVNLPSRGNRKDFEFNVIPANLEQGRAAIRAILDANGKEYSEGYTLVTRDDLGSFYYFQPAVQHVSVVDVKTPKDLKVGYIMGAGDDIPTVLKQIGMDVTLIPADKLASESLSQYGTIVLGVRAYETHKEIVANNKKLLDFVSDGGTLIVQNNNSTGDFNSGHFTPYDADLSRARVSVEEAPVTILAPDDPVFHYPNEISQKDFDGWVQERGLYFMDKWDDHFKPLLSCHDPGEPDQKGGMIQAKYGKGTYIYTGYAFFRQLPAGVPGAIRLFVNLVSAGHQR